MAMALRYASRNRRNDYNYFVKLLEKKIKVAEGKKIDHNQISAGSIHASLVKLGFKSDQVLGKMLRLYGATGKTYDAEKLFRECHISNVAGIAVWNATLATLGRGGKGVEAINMFLDMPKVLVKTETTYWNALVGCSHAGETDCANYILGKMFKMLSTEPAIQHVGTYIDALARKGQLEDAVREAKCLVYSPNHEIIVSILARAQEMKNTGLAIDFVTYLEKRGVSYRVHKRLYENLADGGVLWGSNVKILRQRIIGASSSSA